MSERFIVTPALQDRGVSNFRFPDGVEFLGDDGDGQVSFKVSVPTDDDGYFGRECPECSQQFRIASDDYDSLPDDLRLWCVYCGHNDDHSEFITEQQLERVTRAATDYAEQLIGGMLHDTFGGLARRSRGSFVQISYRSKPFYPAPLPGIDEERLVRERTCAGCQLSYAVFGEHRFCPVCGLLPALVTALDALAAETVRLDVLAELPAETRASLRESGVLDRTYVDTIENLVGIVEATAERIFREAASNADALLKGKGKVFQRLDDLADLFLTVLVIDLRVALGATWGELGEAWAARHVFTHCDGIVDEKYRASVPATSLRVGQRLRVSETLARSTITSAERLCRALAGESP